MRALPPEERGPVTRRLLALSDASKQPGEHAVERAAQRLERLLGELDPPSVRWQSRP